MGLSNRVGNEGTIPTLEIVHEMGLTELPQVKDQCRAWKTYGRRKINKMTHSLHRKGDTENLCDDYVMLKNF